MTIAFDVAEQFAARPTLREVAASSLRQALRELYPALQIDPQVAVVSQDVTSTGALSSATVEPKTLVDSLLEHFAAQSSVTWGPEHTTLLAASAPLPVNMADVGALVNRLVLGLFENFKQALLDYWSACSGEVVCRSRWAWLASQVRQGLLEGLDATPPRPADSMIREWLRDVALFPEKAEREQRAAHSPLPRACLVRLQIDGPDTVSLLLPVLVMFSNQERQGRVLMYQMSGHCQVWSSLDDWGQSLSGLLSDYVDPENVQWSTHEPQEDIFNVLTQAILENQLVGVQGLKSEQVYDLDRLEHVLAAMTDVCALFKAGEPSDRLSMDRLPDWMQSAQEADRNEYSRLMSALAVVQQRSGGRSFNEGLPPILEFASRSLAVAIAQDHFTGVDFLPHQIQVRIDSVAAATIPAGGQPFAVGSVEPVYMTFPEFALENLSGLPPGRITVHRTDGRPLPGWMTADYLKQLTVRVDIGQVYPDLLKRYLVTDAAEAGRRQALFADQLRLQLPLLALEQKIKGELSPKGYQYVCAMMQARMSARRVGGRSIVLRPLAFVRQAGHRADEVANMFVIGPQETSVGPYVLYRPFARSVLTEFASWSALMAAVRRPGALQDDILIWLSDGARPVYALGGFHEPHIIRFGQGSEFAPLESPRPAVLGEKEVSGDIMLALFNANAQALIELADRNAVSNAESRWALFKEGGWLLLNTVLPLLSGAIANAVWLAQLLSGINQQLVRAGSPGSEEGAAQLAELLLNISLVLLHHGVAPNTLTSVRMLAGNRLEVEPAVTGASVTGVRQAPVLSRFTPGDVHTVLDFSWSQPVNRLSESQRLALESFKVRSVRLSGEPVASGVHSGLHEHNGTWLARVDNDLFRVVVEEDEVRVVRPDDPSVKGPRLRHDGQGWSLDLSLHLRGGGPKKSLRKLAEQNAANLSRINQSLEQIERRDLELVDRIVGYHTHLNTATGELRQLFFDRLEGVMTEEVELMKQRMSLWEQLRVGDRPAERHMAQTIVLVTSHLEFLEGRLAADNARTANVTLAKLAESGGLSAPQGVEIYMGMFKSILSRQEKGLHWSQVRESLWEKLRAVPKVGEELWRQQFISAYETKLFCVLDWKIQNMMSSLELCFSRELMVEVEEFRPFKALRTELGLNGAFASHSELERPNDYSLAERIDVLESVLCEYQRAKGIADDVDATQFAPPQAQYLEKFRTALDELCELTRDRLAKSIQENVEPPPVAVEYVPRVRQPGKRVIRTRNHRALVGHVRQEEGGFPGEVADIRNAQTGQLISSWHRHPDDQWVEIQTVEPARPAPVARPVSAGELQRRAQTLLREVEQSLTKARQQATRAYEPEDIEDILLFKAGKLTALAGQMTEGPAADLSPAVADSAARLREAAARLTAEGRSLRIAMTKAQPPTAARVSYLHRQREVNISRFEGRKNMSGAQRNDFLQEYAIRDKDNRLLWWAHFHYRNEADSAQAFTAAHLKLPEQRLLGYKSLIKASGGATDVVNIYRSAIGKDVAQRLFLALNP
ncbi:dermonecrotic toxin domain-containing protein [Pseudomonas sp. NPDC089734]|uniref:dermonecrotic toxin domain-containing protein n=1 Tax=Pseudomonas sp. NPDC089734 TaxID=3364469 RepID=UPI00382C80C4